MDQLFSSLHPNPGWTDPQNQEFSELLHPDSSEMLGKHCILELYDCDAIRLNDEAFVRTTVTTAAKIAGATLLNLITHSFKPQGITGLALLAESHISIHTWPESGYAAVDVFTCGDHTMPERACEVLIKELSAQTYNLKSFKRKTPVGLNSDLRSPDSVQAASVS
tara:strand:+ start:550 stop:1044 length:495 start_codon:yes stop_codon:yes gene_type:complete